LQRLRQGSEPTGSLDAQIERPDGVLVDVEVLATTLVPGVSSDIYVVIRDPSLEAKSLGLDAAAEKT
jgi:hypothetical protein